MATHDGLPEIFADGVISVAIVNGVVRLAWGRTVGEKDVAAVGHTFIPVMQIEGVLQALSDVASQLQRSMAAAQAGGAPRT
jgi:hypothetical protein